MALRKSWEQKKEGYRMAIPFEREKEKERIKVERGKENVKKKRIKEEQGKETIKRDEGERTNILTICIDR